MSFIPLLPRSPPPRSTMSPSPPSPRPNTIQALRDEAANDKCRGCLSSCLPCIDTPATVIQERLNAESNRDFERSQAIRNNPDRVRYELIISSLLPDLKEKLKILNQNPGDNEEQITSLNAKIIELKEELESLKSLMDRNKLRDEHRQAASTNAAIRTLSGLSGDGMGGTINRKTRKYKKNNKKCKSKNRRSKYLKNVKRNRRTYKHRN